MIWIAVVALVLGAALLFPVLIALWVRWCFWVWEWMLRR